MTDPIFPLTDCLIVGGAADGVLLHEVNVNMASMELRREQSLKPLASSTQQRPDIEYETDVYNIHVLSLQNDDDAPPAIVGIAVIDGSTLTDAFSEMVLAYVQHATDKKFNAPKIQH